MSRPFVSVIVPTYNRRRFIPHLIANFKAQDYPQEHMELVVFDDGTDKVKDLFDASDLKNVRYFEEEEKQNKLNVKIKIKTLRKQILFKKS